jgi:hypothetical protein
MENVNLHKTKIISLIIAVVGIIACFLPWWRVSYGGYGEMFGLGRAVTINGLHKLGIVAFIAFIGAGLVPVVLGDKTKPFVGQEKMVTAVCFGAAFLFTLITLVANTKFLSFGIFIALAASAIGALFVWGLVKMPENKPTSAPPPPPAS